MSIASWNSGLSVGVEKLDADHQGLIDLMNNVFEALLLDDAPAATRDALLKLNHYVTEHFAREEAWMAHNACPDLERHRREHQAFRDKVHELLNRQQADGELTLELLTALQDWLCGHIAYSDKEAVPPGADGAGAGRN